MVNICGFKEVREFQRASAGVAPKTVRLVVQSYRLSFRVRRFDTGSSLPRRQSRFSSRETALGWMERRAAELIANGFQQIGHECYAAGMSVCVGPSDLRTVGVAIKPASPVRTRAPRRWRRQ